VKENEKECEITESVPMAAPKKRGRPKKVTEKRAVGRPKGDYSIMKEYRERMLNSPKSRKVLESILSAALDDEHKNQAAAWKLVMDRIAPVAGFESGAAGNKASRNAIQINITGVPGVDISPVSADDDIVDEQ